MARILLPIILLTVVSCNSNIKKFYVDKSILKGHGRYQVYQAEKTIVPLKKEWKELYWYVKKGHILYTPRTYDNNEVIYVYSYPFHKFLKSNWRRIYETKFLQDFDNFESSWLQNDNGDECPD